MILFSLGTHSQDFSRMAKAADEYAATTDERIVVQTGYTQYEFTHVKEHFDFCPKEKMQQLMDEADILVLHGGWGGICEAVDKAPNTKQMHYNAACRLFPNMDFRKSERSRTWDDNKVDATLICEYGKRKQL